MKHKTITKLYHTIYQNERHGNYLKDLSNILSISLIYYLKLYFYITGTYSTAYLDLCTSNSAYWLKRPSNIILHIQVVKKPNLDFKNQITTDQ